MDESIEVDVQELELIEDNAATTPVYTPLVVVDYEAAAGKTAPEF